MKKLLTTVTLCGIILMDFSKVPIMTTTNIVYADTYSDIQTAQAELTKKSTEISDKLLEKEQLDSDIKSNQSEIDKLEKELIKENEKLSERKDNYSKMMVSLQTEGNSKSSFLSIILDSKNISEIILTSMASNKISEAKREAMTGIKENTEIISQKKEDLTKRKDKLNTDKEKLNTIITSFEKEKKELDNELKKLEQNYGRELEEQARQQREIQRKAEEKRKKERKEKSSVTEEKDSPKGNISDKNSEIIEIAESLIGTPYTFGGTSPYTGFDCSGFVQYVMGQAGITVPRVSGSQSMMGTYVDINNLEPGDILAWGGVGSAYHTGIYVGDGQYIHASMPGVPVQYGSIHGFSPSFGRRL